jgi:DNA-binding NarL/FixJ family response regulator
MNAAVNSERLTRLLVVDDHPIIHEGLAQLINRERDMRVEWNALSVDEALRICKENTPDMAVVDITLGDNSGLELVKTLHARWPLFPILVMSIHDDSLYAGRALRAGARGYIMKHAAPKYIIEAIRQVRHGGIYVSEKAQSQLLEQAIAGVSLDAPSAFASLSDRELEIFQLIGKGLKKGEIAARLHRSVNTIEAHRASIKKKLKIHTSAELAKFAFHHSLDGRE